jgi:hypothetical protein
MSLSGLAVCSAYAVDPLNRDHITLDDVHDPVLADAEPEHISPPKGLRRYGSPARASKPATTVFMPAVSSRNLDAVVTARGDHSTLTRSHRAGACAHAHAKWPLAVRPLTTPGTPPELPQPQHPPVLGATPAVPARATAGTQPLEQPQRFPRRDGSPHASQRPSAHQAVRSCGSHYLAWPTCQSQQPSLRSLRNMSPTDRDRADKELMRVFQPAGMVGIAMMGAPAKRAAVCAPSAAG